MHIHARFYMLRVTGIVMRWPAESFCLFFLILIPLFFYLIIEAHASKLARDRVHSIAESLVVLHRLCCVLFNAATSLLRMMNGSLG